ncbi:hypothetical protein HMPREF0977_00153 [Clostridium sp. 1_1_41A1FAA]|nr:hypothetical protein HMPREF0977_00153 [Clostridium sp. 1_1_41A1FAA]
MNNLLLILGLLALSNGNVSLFGNKDKNVSNESLKIDKKDTKKLVQKTKKVVEIMKIEIIKIIKVENLVLL